LDRLRWRLRALDERSRILKGMIGWVGFRTIELPYNRTVRHAGSTKWNAAGLFNLAIESIVSFSRKPLRIFSLISFGLFVSSICYMLASLAGGQFRHPSPDRQWLHSCASVSPWWGYLGVTLAEVKRRPLYFLKHSSKADPVSLHPSMASIEGKKC
jgi:hypothetical protein